MDNYLWGGFFRDGFFVVNAFCGAASSSLEMSSGISASIVCVCVFSSSWSSLIPKVLGLLGSQGENGSGKESSSSASSDWGSPKSYGEGCLSSGISTTSSVFWLILLYSHFLLRFGFIMGFLFLKLLSWIILPATYCQV